VTGQLTLAAIGERRSPMECETPSGRPTKNLPKFARYCVMGPDGLRRRTVWYVSLSATHSLYHANLGRFFLWTKNRPLLDDFYLAVI
jgi:hypothetical protein